VRSVRVRRNSPRVFANSDWGCHSFAAEVADLVGGGRCMRVRCGPERCPPPGISKSRQREGENGGTDLEEPGVVSEGGEIAAEALDTVGAVSHHSLDRRNTGNDFPPQKNNSCFW